MILNTPSPKKKSKPEAPYTCPTCGQRVPAKQEQNGSPVHSGVSTEIHDIEGLAKKVTPEVMKILSPLLEKLQLAVQQQKQEMANSTQQVQKAEDKFQEQLDSLQQAAMNRVKQMELKISQRMGQIQQRTNTLGKS